MKKSFLVKFLCAPFVMLLLFSLLQPVFLPANLSIATEPLISRYYSNKMADDPIVPQPASPEYLIISPNDAWVQPFAEWKTLKGVPTKVANVSWILLNYPLSPTIRDKAEQIWNYIHDVYTAYPNLQWVLLIGDNNTIPSRYIYLPDPTSEWIGQSLTRKPTDFYYSVMGDSDWDDNANSNWGECLTHNTSNLVGNTDEIGDWTPDLYIGRIPFADQTNITSILSQTITYARTPTSFSSTGWDSFLLAGAISNYDEEAWAWLDGDYTDEAELSDYLSSTDIPSYFSIYRYYENRMYFWNYTSPNTFVDLDDTAVALGMNAYSPALANFAGHGTPIDIQRKYDMYYPYGEPFFQLAQGNNLNVSGIAIGDPDHDGFNEIVYTHDSRRFSAVGNGTVWIIDDLTMVSGPSLVWDLWNAPPPGILPQTCWATCIDIGDVWNNNTIAIVVGCNTGDVIIFTYLSWQATKYWTAFVLPGTEISPVLCIEVGNADNALEPDPFAGSAIQVANWDIAWGHRNGQVRIATCFGVPGPAPPAVFVSLIWWIAGQAVYSIDIGNPNDDTFGEVTVGTGYAGIAASDGDSYMYQYIPPGPWVSFTVDTKLGGIAYGIDSGDAANDGFNKVVVGISTGAIYMYEANKFNGGNDQGTQQTVANPSGVTGAVRCLRVGYVDENDLLATTAVEKTSIVAGNRWGGIRKYHADNNTGYLDWYPLQRETLFSGGPMVCSLYLGELSQNTGETFLNIEVAAGTEPHIGWASVLWYEWPYAHWDNMINTTQADASTASIPTFIYADSCHTAGYEYSQESLAEAYLRNMAVGYIGSMRVCWYYRGPMTNSLSWGLGRYQSHAFWQLFFSGTTNYRPGETLYQNKIDYITAFSATHTQADWETYHRKNLISYALFGDPEIDLFTNNPGTLTVTHPTNAFYNGQTLFRTMDGSTPVSGATICLWDKDGSYYEVRTTNSSGYAIFTVTASVPNTLNVTVTAHNYIAYETTIGVQHWLDITQPTISYSAVAGTLDITGVTATCSNTAHGILDDTEATTHTYTIYDNAIDAPTSITGDLSWTSSEWQITDLDVTSLPFGTYYVRCTFADSDVSDTTSPRSVTFSILPPIFNPFDWILQNWPLLLLIIIILIVICVVILLLRRRRPKEEPE